MKNQGISLISLIITIIVVIILAAIAIFSGFGAVDSASLADFAQKYDNVQMAVLNTYSNLLAEKSIAGDPKNAKDIYSYIATGSWDGNTTFPDDDTLVEIRLSGDKTRIAGMPKLPKAGEGTTSWRINGAGKVVLSNGFKYKNGNETKVYVTPDVASGDAEKAIADLNK